MRNNQKKNKEVIFVTAARYTGNFSIAILFSSGDIRVVNFLPLFEKYVKGDNLKYFTPERFKKFIVKNGNIYWGKDEDIIFPVASLLKNAWESVETSEEVLYII